MHKDDLVRACSDKANMPMTAIRSALEALTSVITEELEAGRDVTLVGFGKFYVSTRAARNGVNPKTHEPIVISARKSPGFRAGKELKSRVNA